MLTSSHKLPSELESQVAECSSRALAALSIADDVSTADIICMYDQQGNEVQIPRSAFELFIEVLTEVAKGNIVHITPTHAELTTQEAADMLNMSRPSLIKVLDNDEIPYRRTGNRRKLNVVDVQNYKEQLERKRLESLKKLSALDQNLNLGYE